MSDLGTHDKLARPHAQLPVNVYFDDALFAQPSGYYYGDIFIDCVYCFTVNLRLPRCEAVVTDCYAQPVEVFLKGYERVRV